MQTFQGPIGRRLFCGGVLSLTMARTAYAAETDATSIMQGSYNATRFTNARFAATLNLLSNGKIKQTRDLTGVVKQVDNGAQARLIRFSTPSDMRNVATLTIERGQAMDDLWIYLPSMQRVRRLVTANRADPWVGSDFSLGDILGHKVADWQHALAGSEIISGNDAWRIESVPRSASVRRETGYGKRRSWIRKSDSALLRCDFYGSADQLIKSAVFSNFQVKDTRKGLVQPMTIAIQSARKPSASVLLFNRFATDESVLKNEVSPEALQG